MAREIKWVIHGNVLIIVRYPPECLCSLVHLLSFTKKRWDRETWKYQFEFCPCVVYEDIHRNAVVPHPYAMPARLPRALTTYAGYRNRLIMWARANNIRAFEDDRTPPTTQSSPYYPRWDLIPKDFEFRFMQREVLRCFSLERGGIIDCTPGFGKSELLGLACCLFPKARILITTYNRSVYRTIGDRVLRYVPVSQAFIQRANQSISLDTVAASRVVVCGTGSLPKVLSAGTDYDFCFVDEVHLACTDRAFATLSVLSQPRIFGLTGSLKRSDGSEFRMLGLAGPVRIRVNIADGIREGLVTPVEVRWVPVRMQINPVAECRKDEAKRYGIWLNAYRNQLVAAVAKLYDDNQQVLIMVETESHLANLKRYLPDFTFLHAGVPMREAYEERFRNGTLKKVVSTMMWRQGVDFPDLDVLIRADGQVSNISSIQISGRVIRKTATKKVAYLYDFYDWWDELFLEASIKRRRLYASCTWKQVTLSPSALLNGIVEVEEV
jgi:superfamily II DNA or RNA helicase